MRLRTLLSSINRQEEQETYIAKFEQIVKNYSAHEGHPLANDIMLMFNYSMHLAELFYTSKLSADEVVADIAGLQSIHARMLLHASTSKLRAQGFTLKFPNGELYPTFYQSEQEANAAVASFYKLGIKVEIVPSQLSATTVSSPLNSPAAVPSALVDTPVPSIPVMRMDVPESEPQVSVAPRPAPEVPPPLTSYTKPSLEQEKVS